MSTTRQQLVLGKTYRDSVSGFIGVAVARHTYLNGCERYSLQPQVDKEGKLPDAATFDSPQLLEVPDTTTHRGKTDTGGPAKYEDAGRP